MVSLKSGEISVLHEITLLSDPVTYGTLEVMVDWHYSKVKQTTHIYVIDFAYLCGISMFLHVMALVVY